MPKASAECYPPPYLVKPQLLPLSKLEKEKRQTDRGWDLTSPQFSSPGNGNKKSTGVKWADGAATLPIRLSVSWPHEGPAMNAAIRVLPQFH